MRTLMQPRWTTPVDRFSYLRMILASLARFANKRGGKFWSSMRCCTRCTCPLLLARYVAEVTAPRPHVFRTRRLIFVPLAAQSRTLVHRWTFAKNVNARFVQRRKPPIVIRLMAWRGGIDWRKWMRRLH